MKEYSKGIYVKFKPEEVEILHRLVEIRLFRNGMRPFCSANPDV